MMSSKSRMTRIAPTGVQQLLKATFAGGGDGGGVTLPRVLSGADPGGGARVRQKPHTPKKKDQNRTTTKQDTG